MDRLLRVLLTGSDSADAPGIKRMLDDCRQEIEVIYCERPEDGLSMVLEGAVEVVLFDMGRPGDEVLATLEDLGEAGGGDLPIVAMIEGEDRDTLRRVMQCGAHECLLKEEIDTDLLCRSIRGWTGSMFERQMYQEITESLSGGIFVVDEGGTIRLANPRIEEILGYSTGDLIGLSASALVCNRGEGSRDLFCAGLDRRKESRLSLLTSDGECIHTPAVISPISGGCLVEVREIPDGGVEKYRLMVENLSEGIWVVDQDARTTFVNLRMAGMLGYTPDEMIGRSFDSFIPSSCGATIRDNLIRQSVSASEEYECEFIGKDGSRITALLITSPFMDGSGEFQGSIIGVLDITERKMAEEEIRTRSEHLEILNQIISVSATSLSLDELLEESLEKTLGLLGFHVGMVYMLDPDRRRARIRYQQGVPEPYISRARTLKAHHWPFNFTFIAGQPRYIEQRLEPNTIEAGILQDLGVGVLASIPLIAESVVVGAIYAGSRTKTSFSREDRALLEMIGKEIGSGILRSMLHKRLEAANREANLYLDVMTHDIRNTENVTGLYAGLLMEMLEGEAFQYAQRIERSIQRSKETLGNVSTIRLIHHDPPEIRPIDLDGIIREGIGAFPDTAIEYIGMPCRVWADRLLPEVFINLTRNAVSLGGPETAIVISLADYDDERVQVSFEYTGPGIPDSFKGSIFHRVERGWIEGYGDGLRLFIVRTLVERYGGTIQAEDRLEGEPDPGTSIRFTLRKASST